jgi:predicted Zn-dependent protease
MPTASQRYDEAIELKEAGKPDEAVGKLESLSRDQPDFALAHAALSVFYSKMDRHEEAIAQAQLVCELEPSDPFSFMAKSLTCQRAGKLAEAEEALSQAMELQWAARGE